MLTEDYDLTREDLQLLSSRDALAAFFAKLGYDTNLRLMQSVAAMGITSDTLRSSITHIERLASQDERLFEVYLFELKSVTVAATQSIVRLFRDRGGDYLLVLTDDYQQLDFVLVERYTSEFSKPQETFNAIPSTPKQVGVRPRTLTLKRRNPDQVTLRVLRRFSYTEADTFAQYDKLRSAYDVATWSEPFFNNRALFSDYYLIARLPQSPEWNNPNEAAAMTRAFKQLRELYADVRETFSNQPEAVVQAKLLEPVLTALGFAAQPAKASNDGAVQPDYRLYATNNTEQTSTTPLALCLAYTWGRNLDGKDEQRDSQTPEENPGAAVVTLLDRGEADWAIVTNGKIWRLYAAKAHSRATNYYEIDLEETLALPAVNLEYAFRYFWLLFRATAFRATEQGTDTEQRQLCFLDWLLSESENYAKKLGEQLKERIFNEIFPHFAHGFILHARGSGLIAANLDTMDAEQCNRLLEPYFSGTLTFLYRLLFLLYAESRDLLPVRELRGYHQKSLEKLKRQIADKASTIKDEAPTKIKTAYNSISTVLYDALQELFQVVDKGDAALNVPVYNGGLFATTPDPTDTSPEAEVARFLASHKIPDSELALGLDLMARDIDEKRHDLVAIDYKSLGVRQLGSIYEGLLEFKLRIAPEVMAVVKGKKTEEIVPYSEAQQKKLPILKEGRSKYERTFPQGFVYLENDRRERKATGSYYTPDYIVKYIVENTVGPVLNEKLEALRPAFREAEKTLRAERAKYDALEKQGRVGDSPENQAYLKHRTAVNEIFFDLKVLDPAMGSGHFLVEAVDYITDRMADFLTAFKWNPIIHELAKTRNEIQQEMEHQGVTIDTSKLTDLNLLKRQVLKRCIYGVDLNPMAVELAKVSLWLDCFTLGAPLSFLDHHMKCGNSLIGARVDEARTTIEKGQLSLFFGSTLWASASLATEGALEVAKLSDVTAQQVRLSKEKHRDAEKALAPYKRLLNVYLSRWFGNTVVKSKGGRKADVDKALDFLRSPEAQIWYQHPDRKGFLNAEQNSVVDTAVQAAQDHHFFHWEMEFPEVFFGLVVGTTRVIEIKKDSGFDAVVGNPPYVNMVETSKSLDDFEKPYYRQVFQSAVGGFDLYILFQEQVLKLVRTEKSTGLILPNKMLSAEYAIALRGWLLGYAQLKNIVNYSSIHVFDASVYPLIVICTRSNHPKAYEVEVAEGISMSLAVNHITRFPSDLLMKSPEHIWSFLIHPAAQAFQKILDAGEPLENVATVKGAATVSEAYEWKEIIREQKRLKPGTNLADYAPFVVSGTFGRYENRWFFEKVQYIKDSYLQPLIYLKSNLLSKTRKEQIKSQKIILSGMAKRPVCIVDYEGIAPAKSTVVVYKSKLSLFYLASILNSQIMAHVYAILFETLALSGGYLRFGPPQVARLPIRRIAFTTPPQERTYYLEKAKNLYEYCLSKDDQTCLLGFVEHHLSKEPEESDVVHDLLAFLAEEMIRLNKEKRVAQNEFLDWLVTTLKILPDKEGSIGIDVLVGKSKLADYPGDYQKGGSPLAFEELHDILLKNKARLGVRLGDGGLMDQVRARYEVSLERVLPLKDRLARTDRLIDAVVYRLYGLTEEEVGVVEGRGVS